MCLNTVQRSRPCGTSGDLLLPTCASPQQKPADPLGQSTLRLTPQKPDHLAAIDFPGTLPFSRSTTLCSRWTKVALRSTCSSDCWISSICRWKCKNSSTAPSTGRRSLPGSSEQRRFLTDGLMLKKHNNTERYPNATLSTLSCSEVACTKSAS